MQIQRLNGHVEFTARRTLTFTPSISVQNFIRQQKSAHDWSAAILSIVRIVSIHMSGELDPKIASRLSSSAIGLLQPPRGDKILCTRGMLKKAILQVAQEAYEVGFLAGQKEQLGELTRPGSLDRPVWMNIRLDDAEGLANHKIRFKPVVLQSLLGAGYRCLGDLRWIPYRELMEFHYVGMKTAQQIRAIVRRFEHS
jgi:hypothetical protein